MQIALISILVSAVLGYIALVIMTRTERSPSTIAAATAACCGAVFALVVSIVVFFLSIT